MNRAIILGILCLSSILTSGAQDIDTLYLFSEGTESNFQEFSRFSKRSDFNGKEVLSGRSDYKLLPRSPHRIISKTNHDLVFSHYGDLFGFGISRFFTISKIKTSKKKLLICFHIEDLKGTIYESGVFLYERKEGTWIYKSYSKL